MRLCLEQVADLGQELFFGTWLGRLLGRNHPHLAFHAGDQLDQHEDGQGQDQEVNRRLQEVAVVDRHRVFGSHRATEVELEVGHVHATQQQADRRHDDVCHQ